MPAHAGASARLDNPPLPTAPKALPRLPLPLRSTCRHLGPRIREGRTIKRKNCGACGGKELDVFSCAVLGEATLKTCQTCEHHVPR